MVGGHVSADAGVAICCSRANHETIVTAIDTFEGRKYDYTPRNSVEQNYARYSTDQVERIRNDVVMGALQGLSVRLGSLREGRKSIIFVSEGFTAMLPPQMRRQDASAPADPIAVGRGCRQSGHQPREQTASGSGRRTSTRGCATSTTSPTATTPPSTRWIRAGWRRSSTDSTTSRSGRRRALRRIGARCR